MHQVCLQEDESSFSDCSKIFDRHADCLEGKSGNELDASVTAS